jgi:hypothetical protein
LATVATFRSRAISGNDPKTQALSTPARLPGWRDAEAGEKRSRNSAGRRLLDRAWLDFDSKASRRFNNPVTINGMVTLPP